MQFKMISFAAIAAAWLALPATAADAPTDPAYGKPVAVSASPAEAAKPAGVLEGLLPGLELEGSIAGVWQRTAAANTASGMRESRVSYRADLTASMPAGTWGAVAGSVFAHVRAGYRPAIGLRPTYTATANTLGFATDAGTNDAYAILAQAWYQVDVPLARGDDEAKEHVYLTVGKIDAFVFFDQNPVADDESTRFMNNVFVHNPLLDSGGDVGADMYGFAPGVIVQYANEVTHRTPWALSLGVFGTGPGAHLRELGGPPFVIAQAEATLSLGELPGHYRAYVWNNGRAEGYDGVSRRHRGYGFSLDQKAAESLTLFTRFGRRIAGKGQFDRALTFGIELEGAAWGRPTDSVGLAHGQARTSSDFANDAPLVDSDGDGTPDYGYRASGWERQTELYYRFQLNDSIEITPDFQRIERAGGDGEAQAVDIVGVRVKLKF